MDRTVILTAIVITVATACGPRRYFSDGSADYGGRIDAYVARIMQSRPIPGLAVGVVRGETVVFVKGYGVRSLATREPVTTSTVFHTASLSKSAVASAIWHLVESKRLGLDDRVASRLPGFAMADPRASTITVRQVLSHTAGIPDVEDYGWERPEYDDGALRRYVGTLRTRKLIAGPGSEWHYSNAGYEVLGALIASVAGVSFEEYVEHEVFARHGMRSTTFLRYLGPPDLLAAPHRGSLVPVTTDVYPYNRAHAPSSTMKSTVVDLARFVSANLVTRRYEPLWNPVTDTGDGVQAGFGWFLRRHRGTRMVLNAGRDPGFNCAMVLLPDRNVGVVVLSNYDGQSSMEMIEVAEGLLAIGAGDDPAIPKASINIPLARIAREQGVDAAVRAYPSLAKDERYEIGVSDLITLGHEFYTRNQHREAARFYQLNIDAHPKYFYGYIALARATLKMGNPSRAAELYRAGIALDPEKSGCPKSCYADPELEMLIAP